jgi:hypothetical protein
MDTISYTVDDEPQTTTDRTLTPREILTKAGIDAATHYLVLLHGNSGQRTSYEGKMDEVIHMHPKMRFVSVSTGPTTVS